MICKPSLAGQQVDDVSLTLRASFDSTSITSMNCELVITKGPNADERHSLADGQELQIGRGDHCGLRLRDPSVSRHQCLVRRDADRVIL